MNNPYASLPENWTSSSSERGLQLIKYAQGVLDVLKDVGGLYTALWTVGSLIMITYTHKKFNLEAVKKVYKVRTRQTKLF